jgi:hypothetical protein
MNEPRVYRHSRTNVIGGVIALLVLIGFMIFLFAAAQDLAITLFFVAVLGILAVASLATLTSAVIVSETEISTKRFGITRALGWSEIVRVSARGQNLRLHNEDGSVSLTVDSRLPDYAELLETIFARRPNLFDPGEDNRLSAGLAATLGRIVLGLGAIAVAAYLLLFQGANWFLVLMLFLTGAIVLAGWLFAPQAIVLEGNAMLVKYLFREASYTADAIRAINLGRTQTRNGPSYHVSMTSADGKQIRFGSFGPGSALTYLILKRWHTQATSGPNARFSRQ